MRFSINVPGVSICFDDREVRPFIKAQSKKLLQDHIVPVLLQGACKALELVANNTADAHDFLVGRLQARNAKSAESPSKGEEQ